MQRRSFLKVAGAALSAGTLNDGPGQRHLISGLSLPMGDWIRVIDEQLTQVIERQNKNQGDSNRGGFANRFGIYHASTAANHVSQLATALSYQESRFHQSEQAATALVRALEFLNRVQHDDGTIDLLTTNFHSPPDTGFVVEPLAVAVTLLKEAGHPVWDNISELARRFLVRAGTALAIGGIHTPNHRWVVCMALARINRLYPDDRYLRRIEQWLDEGIDIDPDGQYTERSTAIYSPLVDRCLITVARLTEHEELLGAVRRNLDMTRYLIRPNGELVTEASRRQDQFRVSKAEPYFLPYLFMAHRDQSSQYAAMVTRILRQGAPARLARNLAYCLEDDDLTTALPDAAALSDNYSMHFKHSRLFRIRRSATDISVIGDNHCFVTYAKKGAVLQAVRLASAFFGKGQFAGEMERVGDRVVLRQKLSGPYFQPLPADAIPASGDWQEMPLAMRGQSEVQRLTTEIRTLEDDGKLTVQFDISGTDGVPVALELAFRHGGELTGVTRGGADLALDQPGVFFLETGFGTYRFGEETIEFGPGQTAHYWSQLRGAEPKLDADCVYLTGFTPWQFELILR